MARTARYYHHGTSPAAWVGSVLSAIGFVLAAVGAMLGPSWIVVILGTALVALAGLVTVVMKINGYGQP